MIYRWTFSMIIKASFKYSNYSKIDSDSLSEFFI